MDEKKLKRTVEDTIENGIKALDELNKKGNFTSADVKNSTDTLCMFYKGMAVLCKLDELEEDQDLMDDKFSNRSSGRRGRSMVTGRFTSKHSIADRMVSQLEELYDDAGPHEEHLIDEVIRKIRSDMM